jgi:hypothetical protein
LVLAAIFMLVSATTVTLMRMSKGAEEYELGIISRGWQHNVHQWQASGQALIRQDEAPARLEAGDQRWIEQAILAPMRAQTGSGQVRLEPAGTNERTRRCALSMAPHAHASRHGADTGRRARALCSARDGGSGLDLGIWAPAWSDASSAAQGKPPISDHHLMPLTSPDGQLVASVAWPAINPFKASETEIPQMLAAMAAAFLMLVWLFMRRSNTIASDLIASEARARHLAFHDTLTGLPNRAMMFDRLGQNLAMSRRYAGEMAVHCLDLDRFKEVNDTLGHHAGDELIQQVGRRLTELCRDPIPWRGLAAMNS